MIERIRDLLIGFRKYSIMVIIILISVSFRLTNLINGSEMVELLKITSAAFFAGNMVERITEVIKSKISK